MATLGGISSVTASLNTLDAVGGAHPAAKAASKAATTNPNRRLLGDRLPFDPIDEITITAMHSVDIPREVVLNDHTENRRSFRQLP